MSRGWATRTAVVCLLVLGGWAREAVAERRRVAVIDLAAEAGSPAEKMAAALGTLLIDHPDLAPITNLALTGELVGPIEDHETARLASVTTWKTDAERALGNFEFSVASTNAQQGQSILHEITPTPTTVQLYADLAFLLGQARLGERRPQEAAMAFALAHRLAPQFAPDPARYLPEVVEAFEAANAAPVNLVKLTINGHGRVWIDGKELGPAPVEAELPTGLHVVWMSGPDRRTVGTRITLVAGAPQGIALEDAVASPSLRVQRARARLKHAPDPTARAVAMKRLASLLDVGDAVLLTMTRGQLMVQTWRDRAPGFSAFREVRPDEPPLELLRPLAPPPRVARPTGPDPVRPLPPPPPFYKQRTWQAVIVATVVGVVAGSVALYRARDELVPVDNNTQWDTRAR